MEDLISSLEEQVRSAVRPPSPNSLAIYASSAAQIDNETLKDQVQHLQKKIASMEDMLEDAHTAAERDEAVMRERIKRYKDREEALKTDVNECKKEIERLARSEEHAKQRLLESEEAFRENAVTLENARAEIEVLRSELAVSGFFIS
jgi:CAP-Gly domain-containing linker protein 1